MTDPVFANVTVFGSGTMGSGIAQICSQAGSKVALFDIGQDLLDTGMGRLGAFLEKGVAKGKMAQDEADAVLARVTPTVDFDAAVAEADLVIEAIPERLDLKQKMFRDTAEKVLEIVRATGTDDSTVDRVLEYAKQLRKEPIVVKDSPGFATSRLGVVLGLEAIRMVEAGVASPEDIDKAMELGYRHPMGPLRLTDLVGLDVRMAIADYLREELDSPAFRVPTLMREMVERGETGKKSGKGFYDWG